MNKKENFCTQELSKKELYETDGGFILIGLAALAIGLYVSGAGNFYMNKSLNKQIKLWKI